MATIVKQWEEGEGSVTITYNGSGDGTITLSSDSNEGIDRSMTIDVAGGGITKSFELVQEGKRQLFNLSDGEVFSVEGGNYQVLK